MSELMHPGLILFPEVRCNWHLRNIILGIIVGLPQFLGSGNVCWPPGKGILPQFFSRIQRISYLSLFLGLGMGLFLLQNISISTNVCSSNTMEEAINSGFSIVCWYAFIKYNMYLTRFSSSMMELTLDIPWWVCDVVWIKPLGSTSEGNPPSGPI